MKLVNRQILKNQLAIMELLKSIDYKATFGTQNSEGSDTWCHSINKPMEETKALLESGTIDVGTHNG
jgi:hypothetical protein